MPARGRPDIAAVFFDALIAPFLEFSFLRRALVGAAALSLSAAPVGVFLMLRRMSLAGDAMAHAILPGAAIGYLFAGLSLGAMTLGGLVAGLAVAILAGAASRLTALREDATMAAFYLISLALGVTLVSLRGSNIDLLHVLFGNVLALEDATLILLAGVASLTLVALAILYRPLTLECVDPGFLRSVSRAGPGVHFAFLGLVALNLVAGFHALGTLLAVGAMMLPAATARLWSADLTLMMGGAVLTGLVAGPGGLLLSYHFGLPAGPAIVLVAGAAYALSLVFGTAGGMLATRRPRRHLEA